MKARGLRRSGRKRLTAEEHRALDTQVIGADEARPTPTVQSLEEAIEEALTEEGVYENNGRIYFVGLSGVYEIRFGCQQVSEQMGKLDGAREGEIEVEGGYLSGPGVDGD